MKFDYPRNKDEWWVLLLGHEGAMRRLITAFHPCVGCERIMPVTAPVAEAFCEEVRQEIRAEGRRYPISEFLAAVRDQDGEKVLTILNETWFGMPESMDVRAEDGFGVLCDLCSEGPDCLGLDCPEEWEE